MSEATASKSQSPAWHVRTFVQSSAVADQTDLLDADHSLIYNSDGTEGPGGKGTDYFPSAFDVTTAGIVVFKVIGSGGVRATRRINAVAGKMYAVVATDIVDSGTTADWINFYYNDDR